MTFGSGGSSKNKVWRDIWGAGQGVGSIDAVPTVAECVARLRAEYDTAAAELANRSFAGIGRAEEAAAS
jgi:nitronate monooxygenase